MHLFKTLLAGAALIASTVAQDLPPALSFTSFPSDVTAGEPVTVTWTGADAGQPVTITLRRGPGEHLRDVAVLTDSATDGTYTWNPSEDLEDGDDYALQISQGDQVNYTGQFSIFGGSGSSSSSSQSSSATSAPSTSASSSSGSSTASIPSSADITITLSSVTSTGPSSTISPSANHTMPQSTMSRTVSIAPTPTTPNEEPTSPPPTGNAASSAVLSSPMALIVGALAAFAYLN